MIAFSLPELLLSLKFQTFAKYLTRSLVIFRILKNTFPAQPSVMILSGVSWPNKMVGHRHILYPFIVEATRTFHRTTMAFVKRTIIDSYNRLS